MKKKKYRIVVEKTMEGNKYIVQRKFLFWWFNETFFTTTDDWIGYGDFDSLEAAKKYIETETTNREIVYP